MRVRRTEPIPLMLILMLFASCFALVMTCLTLLKCVDQLDIIEKDLMELRNESAATQNKLNEFMGKWDIGQYEATAYSPYDDQSGLNSDGNPNITATGTKPQQGTIAVNFDTFPPHTEMWVQGYGWGKALDTGGDMIKNPRQVDLFEPTYREAMIWGRKKVIIVWRKAIN